MRPRNIILHHSLTKDSQTVSWDAIKRFHTSYRQGGNIISKEEAMELKGKGERITSPWKDIGYHIGIELVNENYELMWGRPLYIPGAHCKEQGMNSKSVGICFVGNFDKIEVPNDQWWMGIKLVKFLQILYKIPKEKVYGHREFASYKSCPGNLFDLDKFRGKLI